ncbi:MAG: hypothetical protein K2K28_01620, partial [Clostridia bacterium]|nr:hypothetical protein [Clostridia bacterium]
NSVNSFTVAGLKTDKGKIQDAEEGIAAAFKQVGYNANFEITATVTVDTFNDNSGTGFGIMLRDDIYIDKNDKSILSNYVAAGCYGTSSAAKFCYYRDNPASISSSNTGRLDISAQHTLSIKRSGTTVTVKFDNYTYTTVADFDLRGVDSEYMYICLYSTRGTAVTFTNVTYTDLGEGQA